MLVKPHLRRHEHAARSPLDPFHRFTFLPHQRVTGAANDQDVNPRAVAVRFLVRADAPQRYVRLDRVVDHAKDSALRSAAPVKTARKHLAHAHVGDEIGRPLLRRRALLEVTFLAVVAVAKDERVVKDEVVVVERIDHPRRAGHRDVTRRLQAGSVVVLMPGVHRNRKITSFLPLEGFFLIGVDPDRSRALSLQNIHRFFEQMAVRFERLARWDFGDIRVIETTRPIQVEKRRQPVAARTPRLKLEIVKIFDQ